MTKRALPPYVYRDRRGTLYFSKRIGGKLRHVKLQTQFPEGDPVPFALHQERERLLSQPVPVPEGRDIAGLVSRYQVSPRYKRLKPRTQADYDKRLDYLAEKVGHLEPRHIARRHVIEWRDAWSKKAGPHEANYRLAVFRVLMESAIDFGLLPTGGNPAKGVEAVRYEKRDRQPWPDETVRAFREACAIGTRERLIFELLLGSGQRIGDALEMTWGAVRDGGIEVRQGKTGKLLWVPLTEHLSACLSAEPRRGLTILATRQGGPLSYRMAAQAMRKARKAIGAEGFDNHGLRYRAAVELFLAGCPDDEIAAITGQSPAMVLHYTRHVRQKVLALRAKERRG